VGDRERLFELVKDMSLVSGDFMLSSGRKASYYFDLRMVTLFPEGAYLVGKEVLTLASGAMAIGGPAISAIPVVAATAVVGFWEGRPIPSFIVRDSPKAHGRHRVIEGHLPPRGGKVAMVDDVITTGSSLFRSIEAVEAEGVEVVRVIAILDRHGGGSDNLKGKGYDFISLFSEEDFVK
jgi:orotate phosphoribosyltransferase